MNKSSKPGKPEKNRKVSVFSLLKPYRRMTILLIIFTLIGNAANLVIPKIISKGIDTFSLVNFNPRSLIIDFLVATVLIFIFSYLQSLVQTFTSERVALDLRNRLSDKLSRQSIQFIQKADPSKLLTNLTSDIDSVKVFVSHAVSSIASSLILILGTSILLITINWKLALPVIAIIPVIGITFFVVLRKVRVLYKRSREVVDWLNKVINESVLGSAIIRVINSQHIEYQKFIGANSEARDIGISILNLFATLIPLITFVSNLATLAILAMGGHFVINGNMSLGDFAAFNSYVTLLIFPIIVIGFMSNVIAQATASYNRIDDVLNAEDTSDTGNVTELNNGHIEIKNLSLNYDDKPILRNISFNIKPGTQTAIIGPTAAGKSQLLYLLTGLIPPSSGQILIDGVELAQYKKEVLHKNIGLVFQNSVLFNLTLRENIAFSEEVDDGVLKLAVSTSELDDFIEKLPKQLETSVAERGTSLSGGQKQRIMLARALVLQPKILLLDDFTARVDKPTEQRIQCNIMQNYPNTTLISVTQKIAPVKHFDQIILLMEGEILAIGTHKELLASCPEYVQIYNSQKSTNHYELQS